MNDLRLANRLRRRRSPPGGTALAVALLALACGCNESRDGGDGGAVREAAPRQAGAAPSAAFDAAPLDSNVAAAGLRCLDHGVLQSACAGCNPALASVYRAKGDWCAEHELAESFCPICHPETGGMPQGIVRADEPPADGTRVRLANAETARLIGLRSGVVTARAGAGELVVTARIVYDATKRAEVNTPSPGVVRSVRVDVGSRVRRGTPLAELESAGVGADRSRLQAASSRVDVAAAQYERLRQLRDEGIAAEKDVQAAQQELDAARAELTTAQAALGVVGSGDGTAGRYTLRAPIAGVVTRRNATLGRVTDAHDVLFEIADTSTMWAEIEIPETDLARVTVGDRVVLAIDGLADREFSGQLQWVAPEIDPRTRTAMGRVELANPDGVLRANMFARARIAIPASRSSLLVPHGALQRARGAHLVFVRMAPDLYEARRVQVGAAATGHIEVAGRLAAGDSVVTEGSFLLKTETLKESIGAGCCEIGAPVQ